MIFLICRYIFHIMIKIDFIFVCLLYSIVQINRMDYFNKLKDITNIKNIRTSQLEKQKNNDIELEKLNDECPKIVSEYLLFQRYLSRIQQNEMINSSIFDMISVIHTHFEENEKIYKNFNDILKCENQCVCLEKLIHFNRI